MIDRIELKTSQYGHFIETRNKSIPKGISQLMEEDQDIIELKRSDLNPLYRNSIIQTVLTSNGKPYEDPVKFYVFSDPRFNRQMTDRYKIVFNPNKTPIGEVIQFLTVNFSSNATRNDEIFFDDFKIGRIDFNVDITTHSVQEIFRILFFDNKTQKHTALFTDSEETQFDTSAVRTIGSKNMETFYIGKGMYVLRVYDKVKEAKHRIGILKGQELPIPAALQQLSEQKQVTRIELQIRDLYRAGIQKIDTKTGEMQKFRPTKAIHNVRTFSDFLKIRRDQFDVFKDLKFKTEKYISLARPMKRMSAKEYYLRQDWIVDAFNALVESVGNDTAFKKLPPDVRRAMKRREYEKKFNHELDEICFNDIKSWQSQ